MKPRKTIYQFIKESNKIHKNTYDYSHCVYINSRINIKIICKKHGEFYQTPDNHLHGKGCPKCGHIKTNNKNTQQQTDFIKKAKKVHNNFYNYDKVKYNKSIEKICIICPEHGEFWQTPHNHLNGMNGCPKCKSSKGEKQVEQWFKEHNINFIPQKRFIKCRNKNPLPFDFYLPEHNTCIEFDGEQHFNKKSKYYSEKLLKNDNIKNIFCNINNIKLIRIPYFDLQNINQYLHFLI